MPRLSWDSNIYANHRTFSASIYLMVMQAALLMHGALWLAEGILDAPRPLFFYFYFLYHFIDLEAGPMMVIWRLVHECPSPGMRKCMDW